MIGMWKALQAEANMVFGGGRLDVKGENLERQIYDLLRIV